MKGIETNEHYSQHIGTTHYYEYARNLRLTDGVRDLIDREECFWLMDVLSSHLTKPSETNERFLVVLLQHSPTGSLPDRFIFSMQDDIPARTVYASQKIPMSDFPKQGVRLYAQPINENEWCVMLPTEY